MPQSSPICMHKLYLLQSTVAQFQRALYKVIFVDLRHARLAVVATFATAGFIFSNWAARLPVVKEQLDLTGSGLGILLLFASAGSLTALPITGILVDRFGTARVVGVMALTMMTGSAATVTAVVAGSTPIAAASLCLLGVGLGSWDVAMNVEGAAVEERLDKSVMAQFHATWSLGTVAGAGLGALMAGLGTPIHCRLYGVLACGAVTILIAVRNFLPASVRPRKLRTTSLALPLPTHLRRRVSWSQSPSQSRVPRTCIPQSRVPRSLRSRPSPVAPSLIDHRGWSRAPC